MLRTTAAVFGVVVIAIAARGLGAQTPPASTVWSGVYSAEQAERGKRLYVRECARCHGATLGGGDAAPALVGKDFLDEWDKQSVGALYDVIQTTMPDETPGSLASRQYTDITAYMLSENGFPAGMTELPNSLDAMKAIQIGKKP